MKLGVVTTSYPRWPGDLAGSFVAGHVAAMRALGHDIEIIAAGDVDDPRQPAARRAHDSAEHVTRIASPLFYRGGAPEALERSARTLDSLVFTARLAATVAVRSARWDAMVAHWLAPSALACLPSRLPLLAIAHGGDVHLLRRTRLLSPVLAGLRARSARLAFSSHELRELARGAAPSRWLDESIVQPMGVDAARFAAVRTARWLEPASSPARPHRVLVAARLVPVKGVDVAITALAYVRSRVELVVAGDGPLRDQLAAMAPANVTFLGHVDDIDPLLRDASLVVVPSRVLANGRSEGTPVIALEAIAAGVPVIGSAVGGLSDLAITTVSPDDPVSLATAIDHTLTRLAERRPMEPIVATSANLDWGQVAQRLLDHARFVRRAA